MIHKNLYKGVERVSCDYASCEELARNYNISKPRVIRTISDYCKTNNIPYEQLFAFNKEENKMELVFPYELYHKSLIELLESRSV